MKTVIDLLETELKEWRGTYAFHKKHYRGCADQVVRLSINDDLRHIDELEKAIKILKENKQ